MACPRRDVNNWAHHRTEGPSGSSLARIGPRPDRRPKDDVPPSATMLKSASTFSRFSERGVIAAFRRAAPAIPIVNEAGLNAGL
jgi:hypothetical protein